MGTVADHASPRMDGRMRTALVAVTGCGAVLGIACAAFVGTREAVSVLGGAALAVGNLWAVSRIVSALLPDTAPGAMAQSRAGWGLIAVVKTTGLVAITWLLMRHGFLSPLPMLVGFLSLPIGIVIGSLVSDRTHAADNH